MNFPQNHLKLLHRALATNDVVSSNIYNKLNALKLEMFNITFLAKDIPFPLLMHIF